VLSLTKKGEQPRLCLSHSITHYFLSFSFCADLLVPGLWPRELRWFAWPAACRRSPSRSSTRLHLQAIWLSEADPLFLSRSLCLSLSFAFDVVPSPLSDEAAFASYLAH
jgi:hypothetical protein